MRKDKVVTITDDCESTVVRFTVFAQKPTEGVHLTIGSTDLEIGFLGPHTIERLAKNLLKLATAVRKADAKQA